MSAIFFQCHPSRRTTWYRTSTDGKENIGAHDVVAATRQNNNTSTTSSTLTRVDTSRPSLSTNANNNTNNNSKNSSSSNNTNKDTAPASSSSLEQPTASSVSKIVPPRPAAPPAPDSHPSHPNTNTPTRRAPGVANPGTTTANTRTNSANRHPIIRRTNSNATTGSRNQRDESSSGGGDERQQEDVTDATESAGAADTVTPSSNVNEKRLKLAPLSTTSTTGEDDNDGPETTPRQSAAAPEGSAVAEVAKTANAAPRPPPPKKAVPPPNPDAPARWELLYQEGEQQRTRRAEQIAKAQKEQEEAEDAMMQSTRRIGTGRKVTEKSLGRIAAPTTTSNRHTNSPVTFLMGPHGHAPAHADGTEGDTSTPTGPPLPARSSARRTNSPISFKVPQTPPTEGAELVPVAPSPAPANRRTNSPLPAVMQGLQLTLAQVSDGDFMAPIGAASTQLQPSSNRRTNSPLPFMMGLPTTLAQATDGAAETAAPMAAPAPPRVRFAPNPSLSNQSLNHDPTTNNGPADDTGLNVSDAIGGDD